MDIFVPNLTCMDVSAIPMSGAFNTLVLITKYGDTQPSLGLSVHLRLSTVQLLLQNRSIVRLHRLPIPRFLTGHSTSRAPPIGSFILADIDTGTFLLLPHSSIPDLG